MYCSRKKMGIYWDRRQESAERKSFAERGIEVLAVLIISAAFYKAALQGIAVLFTDYETCLRESFWRGVVLALPGLVLGTVAGASRARSRAVAGLGVTVGYLGAVAFWFLWNREEIIDGSIAIADRYLGRINYYYKTSLSLGQPEPAPGSEETAVCYWCVVFLLVLVPPVCITAKRLFFGLYPLAVCCALMAVGLSPDFEGAACGFAGIVLSAAHGWGELEGTTFTPLSCRGRPLLPQLAALLLSVAAAVALPLLCRGMFGAQAERLAAKGEQVKEIQLDMEEQISRIVQGYAVDDFANVNNRTPHYKYEEVMRYTMGLHEVSVADSSMWDYDVMGYTDSIRDDQYLRGYYGMTYDRGQWKGQEELSEREYREAGIDEQKMALLCVQTGKQWLEEQHYREGTGPISAWVWPEDVVVNLAWWETKLEYTGLRTRTAYLPYQMMEGTGESPLSISGEGIADKAGRDDELSFLSWSSPIARLADLMEPYYADSYYTPWNNNPWVEMSERHGNPDGDLMAWYNAYVRKHYLEVPDREIPAVAEIAQQLAEEEYEQFLSTEGETAGRELTAICNASRWNYARIVKSFLNDYYYSLELDRIEDGSDPVQYFLAESGEGYCVHFASAGVLLLRSLGVPARFAAGYKISSGSFHTNADGDTFTASVLDSDAHAWVEVYLDNIGWVPIDVTPRAASKEKLAQHRQQRGKAGGTTPMRQENSSQQPTESSESAQKPQESEKKEERPQNEETHREKTNTAAGEKGEGQGNSAAAEKGRAGLWKRIVPVAVLVCGLLVLLLYRREKAWRNKLIQELKNRKNRAVVRRINHRMYRTLCRRRHLLKRGISDVQFEQLLKDTYPKISQREWRRYMEIAKCAAFSREATSAEDARFCCRMMRRIAGYNKIRG